MNPELRGAMALAQEKPANYVPHMRESLVPSSQLVSTLDVAEEEERDVLVAAAEAVAVEEPSKVAEMLESESHSEEPESPPAYQPPPVAEVAEKDFLALDADTKAVLRKDTELKEGLEELIKWLCEAASGTKRIMKIVTPIGDVNVPVLHHTLHENGLDVIVRKEDFYINLKEGAELEVTLTDFSEKVIHVGGSLELPKTGLKFLSFVTVG